MTIVRRLARPLLAAPLIESGLTAVRHPGPQTEVARPVITAATDRAGVQVDPELVVRVAGGVTVAAGSLLALGKLPRLSALAIVLTAPVVQSSQPFWQEKDPSLRAAQQTLFFKNLGLVGGALLAAVDTQGKPGPGWRANRAAKQVKRSAKLAGKQARTEARDLKLQARELKLSAKESVSGAGHDTRRSLRKQTKALKKQAKALKNKAPALSS